MFFVLRIYPKSLGQLKPRDPSLIYPYGPCAGRRTDEYKEEGNKCVPTYADAPAPQPSERGDVKDKNPFRMPTPSGEGNSKWTPLLMYAGLGVAIYAAARGLKWGAGTVRDEVKDWRKARAEGDLEVEDELEAEGATSAPQMSIEYLPPGERPRPAGLIMGGKPDVLALPPRQEVLALGPIGSEKKKPGHASALRHVIADFQAKGDPLTSALVHIEEDIADAIADGTGNAESVIRYQMQWYADLLERFSRTTVSPERQAKAERMLQVLRQIDRNARSPGLNESPKSDKLLVHGDEWEVLVNHDPGMSRFPFIVQVRPVGSRYAYSIGHTPSKANALAQGLKMLRAMNTWNADDYRRFKREKLL